MRGIICVEHNLRSGINIFATVLNLDEQYISTQKVQALQVRILWLLEIRSISKLLLIKKMYVKITNIAAKYKNC